MSDGRIRVVGLGMAVLDILVRLREMPRWDQGARLSAVAIDGGGPVATAMVAVSRLGVRAGFVGTCGSDRLGEIKMETLVENDLDVSRVVRRPGPENQIVLVSVHEDTGERVFSGLRGFRDNALRVDELDRAYITSADYLHLDGAHAEAALQAAQWMQEAGKTVVLDAGTTEGPVSPSLRALVEHTDVLICGSGFGPALTGLDDLWEVGEAILEHGPRIVVQTEGADGSYTVTAEERFHTPAFEVDVLDTTGAGDVFHGAYIVGLLQGWDVRQVAQFSTAVSAIKCTKLGGRTGIPTFQETMAFLQERGIDLT
ncbi:MAG: PfkB family carbohydrate kinase [Chloroflexota bacterium]|nr:PfkB family carbohydrate kinase [Chloroflexota bacterium]